MKALERDSNHLRPHGSYMEDWRDKDGMIWSTVMPVSKLVATAMLRIAFVHQELLQNDDIYLSDFRSSIEHDYLAWLQVGNKDIVIYHVVEDKVFALTNRDGRLYVISGDVQRIQHYAGTRHISDSERRAFLALGTLTYDADDSNLYLRCL